jgi:DNA-binding MarR family transcriptional regulator
MEQDRVFSPLQRALKIYQARRSRRALFAPDSDIFGEPAWDILLDLYIAHERRQSICLSDASLGAGVPLSTAQRWVKQLLSRGLLVRHNDGRDSRRVLVSLSDHAVTVMRNYLEKHDGG